MLNFQKFYNPTCYVAGVIPCAGYNATVLAYGQTGSGKTYTMGGAYAISIDGIETMTGIIPRVIHDLYSGMQERAEEFEFVVKISYLEVWISQPLSIVYRMLFHYFSFSSEFPVFTYVINLQ